MSMEQYQNLGTCSSDNHKECDHADILKEVEPIEWVQIFYCYKSSYFAYDYWHHLSESNWGFWSKINTPNFVNKWTFLGKVNKWTCLAKVMIVKTAK